MIRQSQKPILWRSRIKVWCTKINCIHIRKKKNHLENIVTRKVIFIIDQKKIYFLGRDLTRNVQIYFYILFSSTRKHFKTLLEDSKVNFNRWKYILCSWIEKLNIIKKWILAYLIHKFNPILIISKKLFWKYIWYNSSCGKTNMQKWIE